MSLFICIRAARFTLTRFCVDIFWAVAIFLNVPSNPQRFSCSPNFLYRLCGLPSLLFSSCRLVDGRIILKWIFRKWDVGGVDWIELAQDRDSWRVLVNAVTDQITAASRTPD